MDASVNFTPTIAVSNFPATQPVSGAVAVSNLPATQPVSGSVVVSALPATPAGTNVIGHVIVDSAPTTAVTIATLPALAAGAATVGKIDQGTGGASAWKVDGSAVTQPVSGTVAISGSVTTTGTTTATLAAGSAVIGHVVVDSVPTTAITAAALPLPSGAASEAGHLATIDTSTAHIPSQGQALAASSMPVVLPVIQAAAMATSANQTTELATLASILAALPASLGLKAPTAAFAIVNTLANYSKAATCAIAGVQLKASAGAAAWAQFENTTGGSIFIQIHDGAPSAGARPVYYGTSSTTGSAQTTNLGVATYGAPCQTSVYLAFSSTAATYTALANTNVAYSVIYI